MPLQVLASTSSQSTAGPRLALDLVVHFPEEIVRICAEAERAGEMVVVACRVADQGFALSTMLLAAGVGSAVITGQTTPFDVAQIAEAFGYGDFTVLLATDDVAARWQAPASCRRLLHADLPAVAGTFQFFAGVRARADRVPAAARLTQPA